MKGVVKFPTYPLHVSKTSQILLCMNLVIISLTYLLFYRTVCYRLTFSLLLIRVLANGILELLDAFSHADNFLLQSHLLCLKVSKLLVQSDGFAAHDAIVPRDLLLNTVKLICQRLTSVLALHGQDVLESLLLAAKDLNLLLVLVKVLMQLTASVCQTGELALQMSSVFISSALHLAYGSLCDTRYTCCESHGLPN